MKKKIYNLIFTAIIILTVNSEELQAQMFWNNACSFAGTSGSYISRGNSSTLNITGSFTLEAWVNPVNVLSPQTQIILQKREGGNVNGYTLYLNNGKVSIRTDASTRLIGQTVISNNNWTHIAGTFNSVSNTFNIYINGSLDTSAVVAGAAPTGSTDSLFIGKGFNGPFAGQMDEVRIWNEQQTTTEVNQYRRTSLGTSSGIYSGLVMSLTFQDNDNNGPPFSMTDWSGNNNNGTNRGATAVDLSDRPLQTININDCIELDGADDFLAAPDNSALSPVDVLTLEAWIFPRSADISNVILHKGPADGSSVDYSLTLSLGRLVAIVNNKITLSSDDDIPLNQWSHVAFVFDGVNGFNTFYLNGKAIDVGINDKGFIIDGPDSLYIGGTNGMTDFDGYLDEVRIMLDAKTEAEINQFMFKSIDESNDGPELEADYNFDGYTVSNSGGFNRAFFRNNASFAHSGAINNQPLSPMVRSDAMNFQDGYYLKSSNNRIPASGTTGLMVDDTLNVFLSEAITDLNVFVATNHTAEQNMLITLTGPNGAVVTMFNLNPLVTNADNMVTIFDDQADSAIVNSRYVSFGPSIKPVNNLNTTFSGLNTSGKWRLTINDLSASDTGRLYAWGIQFNNRTSIPSLLSSKVLIQGFYNPATNNMVRDTMRFYLRYTAAPFDIKDSAKSYLATDGSSVSTFNNAVEGVQYYLQLKHRNSIETWNSVPIVFDPLTSQAQFNFTTAATQAFGDNMIQIDAAPLRFAIYNADENRDGTVDAVDITEIFNDANNVISGYVKTDATGDDFVDVSDLIVAYNNAAAVVSAITPLTLDKIGLGNKNQSLNLLKGEYKLDQNFPNPFNPVTSIKFDLPEESIVMLTIYDIAGKEVATLVNEKLTSGMHEYKWNASNFASGTYFYKITAGNFNEVKKMTVLK